MSDLIRIVYISRATFETAPAANGVEPNVARILSTSRTNNRRNGLVGMLYYGDGCFFQCVEGDRLKVQSLYKTLLKDPRHRELKMVASESIKRLSFPDWSMKYVPIDGHMKRLLEEHGFATFDPYRFDHHLVERVMQLMQGVADPTAPDIETRASAPARNIDCDEKTITARRCPTGSGIAKWALAISVLALILSVIALVYVMTRS